MPVSQHCTLDASKFNSLDAPQQLNLKTNYNVKNDGRIFKLTSVSALFALVKTSKLKKYVVVFNVYF